MNLVAQITTFLPNYTKIKEEVATKFEEHLLQQGQEKILLEVQHKKTIFELKRQNELLLTENIELKETNERLSQDLVIVRGDLASLDVDQIKAEAQADQDARAFLSARKLNPDLMLDLYRLNYTSTH